ncbi:hypothetical protein Ga0466249_002233 [Sporomusaceae bacterium BoRhaA]|nr:hypothetical protein [Pelorhabdus rhamnosifermentans]MBU2701122.1 hypothetical protein [Pelorhabdus rhamnosifermentans]
MSKLIIPGRLATKKNSSRIVGLDKQNPRPEIEIEAVLMCQK